MADKIVRTVCGDIDPEDLGLTTAHEHTISDMTDLVAAVVQYKEMIPAEMLEARPENLAFLRSGAALFSDDCSPHNDVDWLIGELGFFRDKAGGGCVVDASPIGMRGDTSLMRRASAETGVNIVVCTGLYYEAGRAEKYRSYTPQQVYDLCMREVREGIAGSEDEDGVRVYPGFVKCGMSSEDGLTCPQCEWDTLEALARIAGETGLSLHVHSGKPMGEELVCSVARFALDHGCPADRLNMMHLDQFVRYPWDIDEYLRSYDVARTVSVDLQQRVLELGCYIGFDGYSNNAVVCPDNYDRTKALVELLSRGWGERIVLGHDITDKSRSCAMGGAGWADFALNLIPKLYEFPDLVDPDDIGMLIYDNPARLLAFDPGGIA